MTTARTEHRTGKSRVAVGIGSNGLLGIFFLFMLHWLFWLIFFFFFGPHRQAEQEKRVYNDGKQRESISRNGTNTFDKAVSAIPHPPQRNQISVTLNVGNRICQRTNADGGQANRPCEEHKQCDRGNHEKRPSDSRVFSRVLVSEIGKARRNCQNGWG